MTNTTTDLERLNELASLHAGDGTHACRKCGVVPVASSCDTQDAIGIGFRALQRVAELEHQAEVQWRVMASIPEHVRARAIQIVLEADGWH